MMFLWLPFIFAIPFVIFLVLRPAGAGEGCGMSHTSPQTVSPQVPSASGQDPLEIARLRLARGEVTPTEFDEIRRALQG